MCPRIISDKEENDVNEFWESESLSRRWNERTFLNDKKYKKSLATVTHRLCESEENYE